MTKKIHLLTFFNAINYGTFLQAYALQESIKSLGGTSEIINFYENSDSVNKLISRGVVKNLLHPFRLIKKYSKYSKLKKSKELLNLSNLVDIDDINQATYEKVLIGSDEVWNIRNSNVKNHMLFFGEGLRSKSINSYAASFGSTNKVSPIVIQHINLMSNISVRDSNSARILKESNIKHVRTLDPTLIYDFKHEVVLPKIKDYILIYGEKIIEEKTINEIKNYARRKNKKIVSVGPEQKWADIKVLDASPFEFLGYISNSSEVITNTFHGTILSLKLNRKVSVIWLPHKKNKILDICNLLNLDLTFDYENEVDIDWEKVHFGIDEWKSKSLDFLSNIINL